MEITWENSTIHETTLNNLCLYSKNPFLYNVQDIVKSSFLGTRLNFSFLCSVCGWCLWDPLRSVPPYIRVSERPAKHITDRPSRHRWPGSVVWLQELLKHHPLVCSNANVVKYNERCWNVGRTTEVYPCENYHRHKSSSRPGAVVEVHPSQTYCPGVSLFRDSSVCLCDNRK